MKRRKKEQILIFIICMRGFGEANTMSHLLDLELYGTLMLNPKATPYKIQSHWLRKISSKPPYICTIQQSTIISCRMPRKSIEGSKYHRQFNHEASAITSGLMLLFWDVHSEVHPPFVVFKDEEIKKMGSK
ncbi:hypothetical protein MKW98_025270, partial [Papaver atlanticum]